MAGSTRKITHATNTLCSKNLATTLPLAIILAAAMANQATSLHLEEQLAKNMEQTNECPFPVEDPPLERALFGQETYVRAQGCREPNVTRAFTRRVRRDTALSFAEKQKVKASLAFVFDTTGSMGVDLQQAIEGAQGILQTLIERDVVPVSNFVIAPFNDPDVPPVTVTENPDEFVAALRTLYPDGGGDCPELSGRGILNALQSSYPLSYLYVFTDAEAKDEDLTEQILEVIQRKQSQVTFILSGKCTFEEDSMKVYDVIASASGGQVYPTTKNGVKQVLDSVQDTLRGEYETLISVLRRTSITTGPLSENFAVTVENGVEELRISVTGNLPTVNVINPLGVSISSPQVVLQIPFMIVISIPNPEPVGIWNVQVTIQPKTYYYSFAPKGFAIQVKATGIPYKILQGFSIRPPNSLQETANRPLQGTKNYLLAEIMPQAEDQRIDLERYSWQNVEIKSLDGAIYSTQPLTPVVRREDNQVQKLKFLTGPFDIPPDLFKLAFHGFDGNGNPVTRISPNAISATSGSPPYVTMKAELEAVVGGPFTLHCLVESLTPFTLDWYKNGSLIFGNVSYEQSSDAQFTISYAEKDDEGVYTCGATNEKGSTMSLGGTSVKIYDSLLVGCARTFYFVLFVIKTIITMLYQYH